MDQTSQTRFGAQPTTSTKSCSARNRPIYPSSSPPPLSLRGTPKSDLHYLGCCRCRLAQDEERRCTGGEARSGGRLGKGVPKSNGTYVEILTGYGNPDALIGLERRTDQMGDGRDAH